MADRIVVEAILDDGIDAPSYATPGAAGMDVRAAVDVEIDPGERRLVPTGLRLAIPEGYEGQMRPRSGLAIKHGLAMLNAPGTIDSDYRGEISVIVINLGQSPVRVSRGERIAQIVFARVASADIIVVEALAATERGHGGFGSTGSR